MFRPQECFLWHFGVPWSCLGYVQAQAGDTRTATSGVTVGLARPNPIYTRAHVLRRASLRRIQPKVQTPRVAAVVIGYAMVLPWVCAVSGLLHQNSHIRCYGWPS